MKVELYDVRGELVTILCSRCFCELHCCVCEEYGGEGEIKVRPKHIAHGPGLDMLMSCSDMVLCGTWECKATADSLMKEVSYISNKVKV
jgi:hypothetical protein